MDKVNLNADFAYKIVLTGDIGVGKTQIVKRFVFNMFDDNHQSTIGMDISTKLIERNGKKINLSLWDTMGQEQYKSLANIYYKGFQGAIIVFDLTKRDSFINMLKWINNLNLHLTEKVAVLLIGNKADLKDKREVMENEAKIFASEHHFAYLETSAKTNFNIENAFLSLCDQMLKNQGVKLMEELKTTEKVVPKGENIEESKDNVKLNQASNQKKKKSGCC